MINVILLDGDVDILKTVVVLLLGLSSGQLYFILVLIQLTVITPFLINMIKTNRGTKILYLLTPMYLLSLYYYSSIYGKQMMFYQTFLPAWFIFYYVGLQLKIKGYKRIFKKNEILNSSLLCISLLLVSIIEGYALLKLGFSEGFAASQIKISSFLYVLALINLLIVIKPYFQNISIKPLKYLGDRSYGIYYVHIIWIVIGNKVISSISYIEEVLPVYQLFQVSFVIFFSLFSIFITKKIFGENISRKLLGF